MSREKIIDVIDEATGIKWAISLGGRVITALEAAGYAIVPVEPSESMVTDGWMASVDAKCGVREAFRVGYRAMLQSAKGE